MTAMEPYESLAVALKFLKISPEVALPVALSLKTNSQMLSMLEYLKRNLITGLTDGQVISKAEEITKS